MAKKPNITARLNVIIENFVKKKKYLPAIEDLQQMVEEFGNEDLVIYYLGVCYANIGDHVKTIECLDYVSDSSNLSIIQLIQANLILGYSYTEMEDLENAEKALKSAIDVNPQSSMAYSALGYVYYMSKKYDLAIFNFKKALQIDPNNAGARNNLGYTYAEIGINLTESVVECRKAVVLNPKSAAYRDSLGWALYTLGNYKEAVKEFEAALQYPCSSQQLIYEHLNLAIKKRDKRG